MNHCCSTQLLYDKNEWRLSRRIFGPCPKIGQLCPEWNLAESVHRFGAGGGAQSACVVSGGLEGVADGQFAGGDRSGVWLFYRSSLCRMYRDSLLVTSSSACLPHFLPSAFKPFCSLSASLNHPLARPRFCTFPNLVLFLFFSLCHT